MKRKRYISPRCEVVYFAPPRLLSGSASVTEDKLMIGFSDAEATEEAY